MDSDPPGPVGNSNIPPGIPSTGGAQQMDQLGQPKMGQGQMGQSQMGQSQMGQGQMSNPDVKTEDIKSEVSGGENSQEPIYEETDSNDRQSGSQETQKGNTCYYHSWGEYRGVVSFRSFPWNSFLPKEFGGGVGFTRNSL